MDYTSQRAKRRRRVLCSSRSWAASSSCHSCESRVSRVGCCRRVGSVAPSGSLVAAGAGWGLGDDPALRTWSHLGSKVPAPFAPFSFFLLPSAETFKSHFPVISGWRRQSCRGTWDGAGCAGAVFGEVGAMACLHPQRVVLGQVLAASP